MVHRLRPDGPSTERARDALDVEPISDLRLTLIESGLVSRKSTATRVL